MVIKLKVAHHLHHAEAVALETVPDLQEQVDIVVVQAEPAVVSLAELEAVAAIMEVLVEEAVALAEAAVVSVVSLVEAVARVEAAVVSLVGEAVVSLVEAVAMVEAAVVSLVAVEAVEAEAVAIQAEASPTCHDHYQRNQNGYTNLTSTPTPSSKLPRTIRHG